MENELLVNATNEFHLFVDHYKQTLPAALLYESVLWNVSVLNLGTSVARKLYKTYW